MTSGADVKLVRSFPIRRCSDEGKGSCTITCMEPGCTNKIRYTAGDHCVPLYCKKHRTLEGRHSETKDTRPESVRNPPKEKPPEKVILFCHTCKERSEQLKSDWMLKHTITCPKCSKPMHYHKDAQPCEAVKESNAESSNHQWE